MVGFGEFEVKVRLRRENRDVTVYPWKMEYFMILLYEECTMKRVNKWIYTEFLIYIRLP